MALLYCPVSQDTLDEADGLEIQLFQTHLINLVDGKESNFICTKATEVIELLNLLSHRIATFTVHIHEINGRIE